VPSAKRPDWTDDTQAFLGRPGTLPTTFVQVLPPSRVTCRLPSSVPTHRTSRFFGDSAIAKIVQWFSAVELSMVSPPDSSCFCLAGSFVVRSGEIRSQLSPRSFERKRNCAP
jgi:hypothetical protein